MAVTHDFPGASDIVDWFGYWPTFHDAEVLSITLDRETGCTVVIHAFEMTAEVDAKGRYLLKKHAAVAFRLEGFPRDSRGIVNTRIEEFNYQNVIDGLEVNKYENGYELRLYSIFGVDASIWGERISVSLDPM